MKKILLFAAVAVMFVSVSAVNRADYSFNVSLDDTLKIISGYADITYTNNTDDTIRTMNFHLYANMFQSESEFIRKKISAPAEGYTRIDSVFEDSVRNDDFRTNYTMAYLKLRSPIDGMSQKRIRIYFTNKVPFPYLREGWTDGRYDISQWYPKVAVYKDGRWADFQISEKSEFYNEYGDYFVEITLPEKYFMFGTGIVERDSSEYAKLMEASGPEQGKKQLSNALKIVRSKAENVNDFAFSLMSDFRYISETRDSFTVEIACERKNYDAYMKQVDNLFQIIKYFSEKYFPYPYGRITVADGLLRAGGGMEYPAYIVMGGLKVPEELPGGIFRMRIVEDILSHEAGHQWFYLISGSNENAEPFMDEGFATFSEESYMRFKYGDDNYVTLFKKKFVNLFDSHYLSYMNLQSNRKGLPMNSKTEDAADFGDYMNFYSKGFMVLRTIEAMTGEDVFADIMKEYFRRYAFSHPSVDDFFGLVNEMTGDVYYYEMKKLLYENVYTDYSLSAVKTANDMTALVIKNKSETDLPAKVYVEYKDGSSETFIKKIDFDTLYLQRGGVKNAVVDGEMKFMDIYTHDNSLHKGLKLHVIPSLPDYFRDNLYFLPFIDYTLFDKFTYGLSMYFCDVPGIDGEFSLGKSNYGVKFDAGYNPGSGYPLLKLNAYSEQGDIVRTGVRIDAKYAEDYLKISPSIYAKRFGDKDSYRFSISFMSRNPLSPSDFYIDAFDTLTVRGLEASLNGVMKRNPAVIRYDVFSYMYNPLLYSELECAGIELSGGASYKISGVNLSAGLNSAFVYGERNAETSLYLFRSSLSAFESRSGSLGNHPYELFYLSRGFGFVTDDTTSYKALNRVRLSAGNVLYAYSDLILAGRYSGGRYLMQSGMLLNIADAVSVEIPFYNTEHGLLLHDRFTVLVSINLIKGI